MKNKNRNLAALFAVGLTATLALSACGDGFDEQEGEENAEDATSADGEASLVMLIATSGESETAAVEEATAAWSEESGNDVEVRVASDMDQELAQGFAGGNPPDIFYLDASQVAQYAEAGNLYEYEAEDNDDFFPALTEAFTYEETQWCAPKDFSTLALQINNEKWDDAGLTDDDIPTTYDELSEVAETLAEGDSEGLVVSPEVDRVGAFVVGHGGWWLNEDATEPTGTSDEVLAGLEYMQENMEAGNFVHAGDVDTGWGGEAFGTEAAAMTIEGNWIRGAMSSDYPDVDYTVAELPEGPDGPGTLLFTQCWGVASDSEAQAEAIDLVNYLTTDEQQLEFAEAFGVMPSRESATDEYTEAFPEDEPFIAGGEYGRGPINAPDMTQVVADLNSQLEGLRDANLEQMMESFDTNASAVLEQ
jgi:multiple sugar transport system substrate-binding protein